MSVGGWVIIPGNLKGSNRAYFVTVGVFWPGAPGRGCHDRNDARISLGCTLHDRKEDP